MYRKLIYDKKHAQKYAIEMIFTSDNRDMVWWQWGHYMFKPINKWERSTIIRFMYNDFSFSYSDYGIYKINLCD